ncbi:putative reverse transcriptase domain-containing protein, partial [Tanacetum coccineum]
RPPTASSALRRRVMVLAPGQPIPHGRPYRYHLNGPVYMMTARKRVGPLPTHHVVVRHSVDYSFSDHFSSDDSSSSSSSETSSDSPTDALSDSASSRSSSDHSLPVSPLDLLPSPKRIRSPETATDLEDCSKDRFEPYVPREVGLGVDFEDESSKPSRSRGADLVMDVDVVRSDEIEIDHEIQAETDKCFAYADALRDRRIDAKVVVEAVDREESKTGTRGLVEVRVKRFTHPVMPEDTHEPAQEGSVEVTYETLGDLVQRFHDHTELSQSIVYRPLREFKGAGRLRGTASVKSRRVDRLQRGMALFANLFKPVSDLVSPGNLTECYVDYLLLRYLKMPNTRSGAPRIREAVNEQSDRRMAEALRVHDAVKNLRPLMGDEVEQEEVGGNGNGGNIDRGNRNGENRDGGNGNGGNGNRGNGNGNGSGGEYGHNFRGFMPARDALTRWNSHKRTIGNEAAYAMSWADFMKLMTEVYYPRNEIQKMETELWNLTVKGNDLTVYTQRFQELILLCTRMVPKEEDRVERFIGVLPDNIQGNVIAANPARF